MEEKKTEGKKGVGVGKGERTEMGRDESREKGRGKSLQLSQSKD